MTTYHYDHVICEIGGAELSIELEFVVEEASGDGWNEPHEPAHAAIQSGVLFDPDTKKRFGPAPDWLLDMLQSDDDLISDLLDYAETEDFDV